MHHSHSRGSARRPDCKPTRPYVAAGGTRHRPVAEQSSHGAGARPRVPGACLSPLSLAPATTGYDITGHMQGCRQPITLDNTAGSYLCNTMLCSLATVIGIEMSMPTSTTVPSPSPLLVAESITPRVASQR